MVTSFFSLYGGAYVPWSLAQKTCVQVTTHKIISLIGSLAPSNLFLGPLPLTVARPLFLAKPGSDPLSPGPAYLVRVRRLCCLTLPARQSLPSHDLDIERRRVLHNLRLHSLTWPLGYSTVSGNLVVGRSHTHSIMRMDILLTRVVKGALTTSPLASARLERSFCTIWKARNRSANGILCRAISSQSPARTSSQKIPLCDSAVPALSPPCQTPSLPSQHLSRASHSPPLRPPWPDRRCPCPHRRPSTTGAGTHPPRSPATPRRLGPNP